MIRLVLLSNSTNYGGGYLDHGIEAIGRLFGRAQRIAFVPFALQDQTAYWRRARERLHKAGFDTTHVEEGAAGRAAIESAQGIFIGGGNTFRLLDRLQRSELIEPIRARVLAGTPYLGSSAGTGVAAPTIRTTNDMPIVEPESFKALGLVPFQLNCHYQDADPASRHMGETRETRLREYLEENRTPVVALREGSWLEVEGDPKALRVTLGGPSPARIFGALGAVPTECPPGEVPPTLLGPPVRA